VESSPDGVRELAQVRTFIAAMVATREAGDLSCERSSCVASARLGKQANLRNAEKANSGAEQLSRRARPPSPTKARAHPKLHVEHDAGRDTFAACLEA
jgi:hypothetical protein